MNIEGHSSTLCDYSVMFAKHCISRQWQVLSELANTVILYCIISFVFILILSLCPAGHDSDHQGQYPQERCQDA